MKRRSLAQESGYKGNGEYSPPGKELGRVIHGALLVREVFGAVYSKKSVRRDARKPL